MIQEFLLPPLTGILTEPPLSRQVGERSTLEMPELLFLNNPECSVLCCCCERGTRRLVPRFPRNGLARRTTERHLPAPAALAQRPPPLPHAVSAQ